MAWYVHIIFSKVLINYLKHQKLRSQVWANLKILKGCKILLRTYQLPRTITNACMYSMYCTGYLSSHPLVYHPSRAINPAPWPNPTLSSYKYFCIVTPLLYLVTT